MIYILINCNCKYITHAETRCDIPFFSYVVPSAPPSHVTISKVTGTTITVQWRPVNCIDYNGHNGKENKYLLQYEAKESGDTQTQYASGEQSTIPNLMSFTNYSIKVAAVNSAGIGEFSPSVMNVTLPSEYKHDCEILYVKSG